MNTPPSRPVSYTHLDVYKRQAPAPVLFKHFGFTVDNVVAKAKEVLGK